MRQFLKFFVKFGGFLVGKNYLTYEMLDATKGFSGVFQVAVNFVLISGVLS